MCCVWQLKLGMQLRGGMQITAGKHGIVSMEKMSNSRSNSCTSVSLILVSPSERELKGQVSTILSGRKDVFSVSHVKENSGCRCLCNSVTRHS